MIRDDFEFLGLMSVRQVRTRAKDCTMEHANEEKVCFYTKYSHDSKSFIPVAYESIKEKKKLLQYGSFRDNHIVSTSSGYFSDYDGSGFQFLLDHNDDKKLGFQAKKFKEMRSNYLASNTKAVIINYNLHYRPKNLNMTAEIVGIMLTQLFEFLPIGDFFVHPIKIRLFVLHYYTNRPYLFWVDLLLAGCSLNFLGVFLVLLFYLRRNKLETYCVSKEGILNISYILCQVITVYIFLQLFLQTEHSSKITETSQNKKNYYYVRLSKIGLTLVQRLLPLHRLLRELQALQGYRPLHPGGSLLPQHFQVPGGRSYHEFHPQNRG